MKVIVRKEHKGEGEFPTFPTGSMVENIEPCKMYEFWCSCTIEGYHTYIPVDYIENGILNCNYNPTELIVKKGAEITIHKIVYDWALAKAENGVIGWIPLGILSSKENK